MYILASSLVGTTKSLYTNLFLAFKYLSNLCTYSFFTIKFYDNFNLLLLSSIPSFKTGLTVQNKHLSLCVMCCEFPKENFVAEKMVQNGGI